MPRNITAAAKTAAIAEHIRVVTLAFFDFAAAPLYVNNAAMNITHDGNVYLGAGALGEVSGVEESSEQRSFSVQFSLSGIPAEFISIALSEVYQGRDCKMWAALLDTDYQIIDDPVLLFSGLMDTMDIAVSADAEITLTAQSRLIRWESAPGHRYNNAAQRALFPNDKGFEFVESTVEKELVWPDK